MVSGEGSPNSREGDGASVPDPAQIETLPELAVGLDLLRQGRSYDKLDQAVGGRKGSRKLPPSTLSDMVNGKSVPSKDTMVTFLTACGLTGSQQEPWLAAWERVDTSHLRRPAGAVRARSADPRLLGVHASIQVDPATDDLPVYVRRDVDADLRTAVTAAKDRGGFVLVKGSSSVGKTRALFEAVKAVCPEWWLLHPADAAAVRTFAATPAPRTVVWLDELQRYLAQPGGIPACAVRALLDAKLLVVATLWPSEYTARTALRASGQADPYVEDRALLGLARIIEVPDTFSHAERTRAEELAADRRIRAALDTTDAGVTQVLAAGPELIRWWEHADVTDPRQCYGKAVITAALDARRVGATAPLTRHFLTAAAPAYLTSAQQATAPPDWFDHAIGYATTQLHGATACLNPRAAGMGQTAGWITADYLYQHARKVRRTEPLPDLVWQALTDYHHPDDTMRLADNAARRNQLRVAEIFYRQALDTGNGSPAYLLGSPAYQLVELLAGQGRVDEAITVLRQRADAGDWYAVDRLADLLAEQGHVDELRQRADAGDWYAALRLVELLAGQGRIDEAITVLRQRADAGDWFVVDRLVELLVKQGHIDELRQRADDDGYAANRLADLLTEQGRTDEAITVRQRADAHDGYAAGPLADLLAKLDRIDEAITVLRRANDDDGYAAYRLADLLGKQGRIDELRQRADAHDGPAANRLIDLLTEQGCIDELEQEVNAGTRGAADRLAALRRASERG